MIRLARSSALCLAIMVGLMTTSIPTVEASVEPSQLNISISVSPNKVLSGSGTLTNAQNRPIHGASINISVNDYPATTVRTDRDGHYHFSLDIIMSLPEYQVKADYAGDGRDNGSATAATVFQPSTNSSPEITSTQLSLHVNPDSAVPGMLVTLTGRLVSSGMGLPNALITFTLAGRKISEPSTSTSSDGSFITYLALPETTPVGKLDIGVNYAGSAQGSPAANQVSIEVLANQEESTPSPLSIPSTSATSPSPIASPITSPKAITSSPTPSAIALTTNKSHFDSTLIWLAAGLGGIILIGVLVTFGLVIHDRIRNSADSDEGVLDQFDSPKKS